MCSWLDWIIFGDLFCFGILWIRFYLGLGVFVGFTCFGLCSFYSLFFWFGLGDFEFVFDRGEGGGSTSVGIGEGVVGEKCS